jgi:peptidoglycan/xylan/chitin deacetylase (PgdA/CDA1 family)
MMNSRFDLPARSPRPNPIKKVARKRTTSKRSVALVSIYGVLLLGIIGPLLYLNWLNSYQRYHGGSIDAPAFNPNPPAYEYSSPTDINPDYQLPLAEFPANYDAVAQVLAINLDNAQKVLLLRDGMTIAPSTMNSFSEAYATLSQSNLPFMLTADSLLALSTRNYYDIVTRVQKDKLSPLLREFLKKNITRTLSTYNHLSDQQLKTLEYDNLVYLGVALKFLDPGSTPPDLIQSSVQERLSTLGNQWEGICPTGTVACRFLNRAQQEDQSDPDPDLLSYYQTITWLNYYPTSVNFVTWTQQAILLADSIKASDTGDTWNTIYAANNMLLGSSATPSMNTQIDFSQYDRIAQDRLSRHFAKQDLLDSSKITDIATSISAPISTPLSAPLSSPIVEEQQIPASLARAAALGSPLAWGLLSPEEQQTLTLVRDQSPDNMDLGSELDEWMLAAMIPGGNNLLPTWMSTPAWQHKNITSALAAAYLIADRALDVPLSTGTQIDTSTAAPADRQIWIEPNPELYARMSYLAQYLKEGLEAHDLLDDDAKAALQTQQDLAHRLEDLARKQLRKEQFSSDDQAWLITLASQLSSLPSFPASDTAARPQELPSLDPQPPPPAAPVRTTPLLWLISAQTASDGSITLASGPVFDYQELQPANPAQPDQPAPPPAYAAPAWNDATPNPNNFSDPYDYPPTDQYDGSIRIPVLMYHHIAPLPESGSAGRYYVSPEVFELQMAYLAAHNYKTLTPQEFHDQLRSGQNPSQKSILLTFDDGPGDNYNNAFPILRKYSLTGTFYVVTDHLGISAAKLKEMSDAGMVIDSHSVTHRDLSKIWDTDVLRNEIVESKSVIQSITGKTVTSFCYPGCVANTTGINLVAANGYLLAFSCGKSIDHYYDNRYTLSRLHVYDDLEQFKKILSGTLERPPGY